MNKNAADPQYGHSPGSVTASLEEALRTGSSLLPESLRTLLDGGFPEAAVAALVENLGGQTLYIPAKPKPDNALAKAIGLETAQIMGRMMGGVRLCVPKASGLRKEARNVAIRREFDAGIHRAELCRRYDLSERQIWSILGGGE